MMRPESAGQFAAAGRWTVATGEASSEADRETRGKVEMKLSPGRGDGSAICDQRLRRPSGAHFDYGMTTGCACRSTGGASPVATFLRPAGAKNGRSSRDPPVVSLSDHPAKVAPVAR